MSLIKINNNSLSAITGLPAGVGGKVLQVVQNLDTTSFNTTGTSFVTGGNGVTITPSSTSNKIYIIVGYTGEIQGRGYSTIYRDSTNLNGSSQLIANQLENLNNPVFMQYLDSPSSTSSITYKVAIRSQNSGQQNSVGTPIMYVAMEIAG